jgi:hypothetical protein
MKRIKTILVKNERGATIICYTPNFLGESEYVLLNRAKDKALQHNGKLEISYWDN